MPWAVANGEERQARQAAGNSLVGRNGPEICPLVHLDRAQDKISGTICHPRRHFGHVAGHDVYREGSHMWIRPDARY